MRRVLWTGSNFCRRQTIERILTLCWTSLKLVLPTILPGKWIASWFSICDSVIKSKTWSHSDAGAYDAAAFDDALTLHLTPVLESVVVANVTALDESPHFEQVVVSYLHVLFYKLTVLVLLQLVVDKRSFLFLLHLPLLCCSPRKLSLPPQPQLHIRGELYILYQISHSLICQKSNRSMKEFLTHLNLNLTFLFINSY